MQLSQHSQQNLKAAEYSCGEDPVSSYSDIEGSCFANLVSWKVYHGEARRSKGIPFLASSKQWFLSQCEVKIVTLWPIFCRPTAASIIRRSAPPMPRSGWKNTIFFGVDGIFTVSKRCLISTHAA